VINVPLKDEGMLLENTDNLGGREQIMEFSYGKNKN
jgi:hypothetical protein